MANYRKVRIGEGKDCVFISGLTKYGCGFLRGRGFEAGEWCEYYHGLVIDSERLQQCIDDDEVDDTTGERKSGK